MPDAVAFLRGINVGGHRVKMDRLRGLFREMGLDGVSTVLASGNVLFRAGDADPEALRRRIEARLGDALGYAVPTFLRTPGRLAAIVAGPPSPPGGGGGTPAPQAPERSHYVLLLREPAPAGLRAALGELESETDRFTFDGHEAHWWIQGKMSESPLFGGALDRALEGLPNTMRNVNTLRRIVAKVHPG